MLHNKYDKDITGEADRNFANQIKRKTARTRRLQRMMSSSSSANSTPKLERTTSWNEQRSEICKTRKDRPKHPRAPHRAVTLDMSKTMGFALPETPTTPLDSVFEEDEEKSSGKPLLNKENEEKSSGKPFLNKGESHGGLGEEAAPAVSRRGHGMERQMAMDELPMKNLRTNSQQ